MVSSRLSLAQSSSEDKSDQVKESSSKPESDLPLYSDSASVVVDGASVPSVLSPQDDSVVAVSGRKVGRGVGLVTMGRKVGRGVGRVTIGAGL